MPAISFFEEIFITILDDIGYGLSVFAVFIALMMMKLLNYIALFIMNAIRARHIMIVYTAYFYFTSGF
jgi:hypothetical protein